jgi:hypothetical protein
MMRESEEEKRKNNSSGLAYLLGVDAWKNTRAI